MTGAHATAPATTDHCWASSNSRHSAWVRQSRLVRIRDTVSGKFLQILRSALAGSAAAPAEPAKALRCSSPLAMATAAGTGGAAAVNARAASETAQALPNMVLLLFM